MLASVLTVAPNCSVTYLVVGDDPVADELQDEDEEAGVQGEQPDLPPQGPHPGPPGIASSSSNCEAIST